MASAKATVAEVHSLPLLQHLAHTGRRAAEGELAVSGLRPRHLVALRVLSEHGPASQHGLAEVLTLDPSNVVGISLPLLRELLMEVGLPWHELRTSAHQGAQGRRDTT